MTKVDEMVFEIDRLAFAMPNTNPAIAILWGHHFAEIVAALMMREFRQANIPFTVISLSDKPAYGQNGLSITTDLHLEKALPIIMEAPYLIIPCTSIQPEHHPYRPALQHLFQQMAYQNTKVVTGNLTEAEMTTIGLTIIPPKQRLIYPHHLEKLVGFIRSLVQSHRPTNFLKPRRS